jgi:uncharacterized SAM-binding protein YcdF (DUF218 family)
LYNQVEYLARPYVLLLLLLGVALAYLWRKRPEQRHGLRWLVIPFLLLVVLSTPAVGYLAVGSLEWRYPPRDRRPEDAEVIVVLGGGVLPQDRNREQAELDAASVYRALHAARLYRQGNPCPILVSGGKLDPGVPGPACADLMAELLVREGVRPSDLIVENTSRTTYENATESRKVLEARQVHRVVLVTEGIHLHRAVLCFRRQGIGALPSGCHYEKTEFKASLYDFLPAVSGMRDCEAAAHEWLGIAWYWLAGRI